MVHFIYQWKLVVFSFEKGEKMTDPESFAGDQIIDFYKKKLESFHPTGEGIFYVNHTQV